MQYDEFAYKNLLNCIDNQFFTEKVGEKSDLKFLSEDWWLSDTAVIEKVSHKNGGWDIHLVFAYAQSPYRLIRRFITTVHHSSSKALMIAGYMRRAAAKDQRGTLAVNIQQFALQYN